MKPFMGNPCGHGYCRRDDCEKCPAYIPTFFGRKVPKWLGNLLFRFEAWLFRPKGNKF